MATIRKLLSGNWQAIIRKKGNIAASDTFTKRDLAVRWARKTETDMEMGVFLDDRKASRITISEMLKRYESEVLPTRSDNGKAQQSKVNIIRRRFGKLVLTALTADMIEEFVEDRQDDEYSNDTILKDVSLIFDLYERIDVLWKLPCINPMIEARRRFKLKKNLIAGKGRNRRLEGDEYIALISNQSRYSNNTQSELIIFAIETAMRREEITRLKWHDINYNDSTLYIPKAKHGPRTIPLTANALEILKILESLPVRIDGRIWGMEKKSISRAFKRLIVRVGITDLRFHDLRHEATSILFEKGLSIPEVQVVTGHGDWRSLKRYTQLKATDVGKKLSRSNVINISGNVSKIG